MALAIGFALLASAFGLVATVDDVDMSWPAVSILVISVFLFIGCALFSLRLAMATFRIWRRGRNGSSEAFGSDPRSD